MSDRDDHVRKAREAYTDALGATADTEARAALLLAVEHLIAALETEDPPLPTVERYHRKGDRGWRWPRGEDVRAHYYYRAYYRSGEIERALCGAKWAPDHDNPNNIPPFSYCENCYRQLVARDEETRR